MTKKIPLKIERKIIYLKIFIEIPLKCYVYLKIYTIFKVDYNFYKNKCKNSPSHLKKFSIFWRKILGESKFMNYHYDLYLLVKRVI